MSEENNELVDLMTNEGEGEAEPTTGVETASAEAQPGEVTEATPAEESTKEESDEEHKSRGLYHSLKAERAKRQELEARLDAFERQQNAAKGEDGQSVDPSDAFYSDPYAATQQMLGEGLWQQRAAISQDLMRSQHADYDEVEAEFADMVKGNEGLRQQLRASPNPARFAYEYVKDFEVAGKYSSVKEMRADIEKDIRSKLEAEYRAKHSAAAADTAPRSLASARSVNGFEVEAAGDESHYLDY